MNNYHKILRVFTGKKTFLIITAGLFVLTSNAQAPARFAGEWKLNAAKTELNLFPLCVFGGGDRLRSRTMKIAHHADLLTVDVASESADGSLVTRQERIDFDGAKTDTTYVGRPRERSTARWSTDGLTMTVKSVRSFDTNGETADFKVTEVWRLSDDGKSISVQVNLVSGSTGNIMKLVYDKQLAADYRF